MIDIITVSIVVGVCLIVLLGLKSKKIPTLVSVLTMLLYAQSLVYGIVSVLISIGIDFPLIEKRWLLAFGGIALIWIAFESLIRDLSGRQK
ncbi:hypothetical protein DOJK_02284 [Patescibacteria group bacterium]|nr:hypothetical protein DOJK_02284 [Patescibacteria group bacterium]